MLQDWEDWDSVCCDADMRWAGSGLLDLRESSDCWRQEVNPDKINKQINTIKQ